MAKIKFTDFKRDPAGWYSTADILLEDAGPTLLLGTVSEEEDNGKVNRVWVDLSSKCTDLSFLCMREFPAPSFEAVQVEVILWIAKCIDSGKFDLTGAS